VSLPVPSLDNRSYADLVQEAIAAIPAHAPDWTNHNASDPGVTLLELFAWLTEMLLYRADRIPERHVRAFLRLLNGPNPPTELAPTGDLDGDVRASLAALRARTRAVSCADYEFLALEASTDVARAHCVPRRYLQAGNESERQAVQPGYVSVIVVPKAGTTNTAPVRASVRAHLDPLRVLTTRLAVADPVWAPVRAEILIARRNDVSATGLAQAVAARLQTFLDPVQGGPDATGWPFGRGVFVSELYEQLEQMPEVDYVADIMLASSCPAGAERCVPARRLWHESGDFIGLDLGPHHLPQAAVTPAAVVSATSLFPVRIAIAAHAAAGPGPAELKGAIKQAIRGFFRPGVGWPPSGSAPWDVGTDSIESVVAAVPGIESVDSVDLDAEPGRISRGQIVTYVRVLREELVDATVEVTLS
jgi:hypothetical protein